MSPHTHTPCTHRSTHSLYVTLTVNESTHAHTPCTHRSTLTVNESTHTHPLHLRAEEHVLQAVNNIGIHTEISIIDVNVLMHLQSQTTNTLLGFLSLFLCSFCLTFS